MKGMVFKGNDKPIANMNKHLASMKSDDGKRAKSSPFQQAPEKKKKGFPEETETKENKIEVSEGVTLDPSYEDTLKIQKVQREGITPHSQKFGKIADEKMKKKQ